MTVLARPPGLLARLGHWLFGRRLLVGFVVVAAGLALIHPRRMFGPYELLGNLTSALLLALGMALRIWAGGSAGNHTRTGTIEAPDLVTSGPYAFVRNPIYLGTVLLSLGLIGLVGDPAMLLLATPAFAVLYLALVRAEEEFLRRRFGAEYQHYCRHVPRIIPRLTPWAGRARRSFDWSVLRGEAWILGYLVLIYLAMRLVEYVRS